MAAKAKCAGCGKPTFLDSSFLQDSEKAWHFDCLPPLKPTTSATEKELRDRGPGKRKARPAPPVDPDEPKKRRKAA